MIQSTKTSSENSKVVLPDSEMMINLHNYKAKAQTLVKPDVWDYIESGALDEVTLRRNTTAFNKITLHPRILRDMSKIDLETSILGNKISMPICIAPTAAHQSLHEDGERATIRAACRHKTLMTLSSNANCSMEDIASEVPEALRWYQLYIYGEKSNAIELIRRAEKSGYTAIVVTCDTPAAGLRECCIRKNIRMPTTHSYRNLDKLAKKLNTDMNGLVMNMLPGLSLEDLKWLKALTKLPIVIKGVQHPEDAKLAVENGADAIWVSNHGGRMLDGVPATINLLPEIVKAVQGKVEVYFDSGVRRGTDVFKALALGAQAVFVGRPVLWGLACGGEKGVYDVLEILKRELVNTMKFVGCNRICNIRRETVGLKVRPKL